MFRSFLAIASVLITLSASAQQIPCHTDEKYAQHLLQHPELRIAEEQANTSARAAMTQMSKDEGTRYIPVVFHVIHAYGNENISHEQILDQMRILNEDFRKIAGTKGGSSTDRLATDMDFEFRLAQYDPSGKACDGVNRVYSQLTYNANDYTKSLIYWPSDRYLNIWVVSTIKNTGSGTILGYAQFPWSRANQPTTDGIIIRSDVVGTVGTGSISQSGRTLTHEIGHWLGLYHTFQNGCGNSSQSCSTQGDQICDTPPAAAANYGCNTTTNSCISSGTDLPDQVRNYMDYTDGTCMNMFTAGQKTRALSMTSNFRSSMYSTNNLGTVGVNNEGTYTTLAPSTINTPMTIDFNKADLAASGVVAESFNIHPDTSWILNKQVGYSDNSSIYVRNIQTFRLHTRSSFTTPVSDISQLGSPALSFNIAYARRLSGSADKLLVYVSNNMGRTETLVQTYTADMMQTGAVQTTEFIPTNSEWKNLQLNLSAFSNYTNLSIRFEFVNIRGNNIYLDDIAVTGSTGIEAENIKAPLFSVFPNPATQSATISFELPVSGPLDISIYDMSGRHVKTVHQAELGAGSHQVTFNRDGLGAGIYFIKAQHERFTTASRIAFQ